MRSRPLLWLAALTFALSLACGSPMEQAEWGYEWAVDDLTQLRDKAPDEASRAPVDEALAGFDQQYQALPADGDARIQALAALEAEVEAAASELAPAVDQAAAGAAEQAQAELEVYKSQFYGTWTGGGVTLTISPGGHVDYSKNSGAGSKSVSAPIQEFTKDRFVVGALGITTTFTINVPPHQIEGGYWVMTVDGVQLTWVSPA